MNTSFHVYFNLEFIVIIFLRVNSRQSLKPYDAQVFGCICVLTIKCYEIEEKEGVEETACQNWGYKTLDYTMTQLVFKSLHEDGKLFLLKLGWCGKEIKEKILYERK